MQKKFVALHHEKKFAEKNCRKKRLLQKLFFHGPPFLSNGPFLSDQWWGILGVVKVVILLGNNLQF